jgi:hypothetical protein
MQFFKTDGYGSGYRYCSCGYLIDMAADMVLLSSRGYRLSTIFHGLSDLFYKDNPICISKNQPPYQISTKWSSLYIDYNPTYYIIIACLYVYSSLLISSYMVVAYIYFFRKNHNIKFTWVLLLFNMALVLCKAIKY